MKRYIKYFGLLGLVVGLTLFVLHLVLHVLGNGLLYTGLVLVLAGVILYVKGEGLLSSPLLDEENRDASLP